MKLTSYRYAQRLAALGSALFDKAALSIITSFTRFYAVLRSLAWLHGPCTVLGAVLAPLGTPRAAQGSILTRSHRSSGVSRCGGGTLGSVNHVT